MKKLLLLILPLLFLSACKEENVQINEPIRAVKTITITEDTKANSRSISGAVKSTDESALSFRVGGRVGSVDVKIGDRVEQGQVLASLEGKEYKLAVESAQAQLASAKSDLIEKTDSLRRQKNLKKKDFVAQAAVDKAQAAYDAAKSNVDVAKAQLENAEEDLSDTVLTAPFNGSIVSRDVEPFTEITPGSPLFVIQSNDAQEIEVLMPETLIRDVSLNDTVTTTFPTLKDVSVSGFVSEIGAKAASGNAFPVTVQLEDTVADVRSGMTAQIAFNFGATQDASVYLIPVSALDVRVPPEGKKVDKTKAPIFVLEDGVAKRRIVTIRDIRGNEFEVIDGLNPGDLLITAGTPYLRDGQEVKKWDPTYNDPAVIQQ